MPLDGCVCFLIVGLMVCGCQGLVRSLPSTRKLLSQIVLNISMYLCILKSFSNICFKWLFSFFMICIIIYSFFSITNQVYYHFEFFKIFCIFLMCLPKCHQTVNQQVTQRSLKSDRMVARKVALTAAPKKSHPKSNLRVVLFVFFL